MAEHHSPEGDEHSAAHEHSEGTERIREVVRDGFTIMLGAASWAFEQGDRLVDTWMHQGHVSREEGRRRFDEFASSTRRRGEDLGRRVSESMRSSMPVATRDQVAQLERQVAELTRQLEAMKASGAASASGSTATRDRPQP
jgi:polyhydroxyalkanoate synthesis regulator phasin